MFAVTSNLLETMNLSEPIFNRCEIEIRAPPALVQSVVSVQHGLLSPICMYEISKHTLLTLAHS